MGFAVAEAGERALSIHAPRRGKFPALFVF
jgi:hypothetical protein